MKSQIRHVLDKKNEVEYDALAFWCPGCEEMCGSGLHLLPVNTDKHSPAWTWDGNLEAPTLSPSILTGRDTPRICHSFLKNGIFEFLSDCTHKFANQHIPIPDLPDWFTKERE